MAVAQVVHVDEVQPLTIILFIHGPHRSTPRPHSPLSQPLYFKLKFGLNHHHAVAEDTVEGLADACEAMAFKHTTHIVWYILYMYMYTRGMKTRRKHAQVQTNSFRSSMTWHPMSR